jgi:hypothetical protein
MIDEIDDLQNPAWPPSNVEREQFGDQLPRFAMAATTPRRF